MHRVLVFALWCVCFSACASPPSPLPFDAASEPAPDASNTTPLASAVDDLVMRVNGRLRTLTLSEALSISGARGVSIAVAHPGQEIETFYLGQSGSARLLDSETLFQAASISKAVTALALHAESDASWRNEDVRATVPEVESPYRILADELLSHSAGATVHGFAGYEEAVPLPSLIQILRGEGNSDRVSFEGAGSFSYSGGGYVTLQLFLERKFGQSLDAFVRRNLLEPAGTERATFSQPISGADAEYAACGAERGTASNFCRNVYPEQAAAGFWTTPRELVRIARFVTEERPELLQHVTRQIIETDTDTLQMGLGLFVSGDAEQRAYQHDGSNIGFCSTWVFFADGRALSVMENSCTGLSSGVRFGLCRLYGWTCD